MEHNHLDDSRSGCTFCKNNLPFNFPSELIDDVIDGKVVIFAGAGISTESSVVFPNTFYESILEETDIEPENGPSFPDLMSEFCKKRNGRTLLLQKIKQRLDYIKSFPELYRSATQFHRELATVYLINTIITTNWDDYFESECGAMPIVVAEDFAFWNMPGRKVFKIHGSVNSFSSIIATREDYEKCYELLTNGLIGSCLKTMLATKTIVYIGFSFRDDDFLRIHNSLSKEMGDIRPCSYIITLDQSSDARFKENGLIPIYTSGEYFVNILKEILIEDKLMLDDENFTEVEYLFEAVADLHKTISKELNLSVKPDLIYLLSYQDGLLHSLERMLSLRNTGYYSNPANIFGAIDTYRGIRKEKLSHRNYFDVAYIDGYIDGLSFLIADDELREFFSPYYVFGYKGDIENQEDFEKVLEQAPQIHKASHNLAVRLVKKRNNDENLTLHHTPFL
ncbi:MAG: SIR2 family protein [Anaerolineaceae bacterium]|nr:SIR2 family protein [Anaerolineaceae bacterium]